MPNKHKMQSKYYYYKKKLNTFNDAVKIKRKFHCLVMYNV